MFIIGKIYRAFAEATNFKIEPHLASEIYAAEESISLKTLKQISYILASEGPNKNRDFWTKDVLEACYKTIINEHININHARDEFDDSPEQIVGHNVASEIIQLEDGRTAIKTYAVLYDYAFKGNETYQQLLGILESGALRASMEVLFTDQKFVTEDGTVVNETPDMMEYLSFLVNKDLYRVFDGEVKFCGAAMLLGVPPADPMAIVEDEDVLDVTASSELTNFPKQGDNKEINLANSEFSIFDVDFIKSFVFKYPTAIGKPINFNTLLKIAENSGVPTSNEEKATILAREFWMAKHFNEACYLSQASWLGVGFAGQTSMMSHLNKESAKIDLYSEDLIAAFDYSDLVTSTMEEKIESRTDTIHWLKTLSRTLAQEVVKVLSYKDLPLDMDSSWSGSEAKKRVWNWSKEDINKYSGAFTLLRGDKNNKTSYRFGIGDIVNGRLVAVWRGVAAAMAAVHGARSKPDIPENVRKQLHNHLAKYYKKAGETPPDFE